MSSVKLILFLPVGTHGIEVGGFQVHSSGKRVVINATIDNLLKGAATQALQVRPSFPFRFEFLEVILMLGMQNMNLALGYAEFEGIPLKESSSGGEMKF